ncbi:MAG: DUF3570 domain-containing protein [Myxococcota bacterium]
MAATRRALPPLLLLLLLASGSARAEQGAASSLMVYTDNDGVTVVSPTVSGAVNAGPATLDARVTLDIISAASVDLVTAASPRGFEETRTEAAVGAAWDFGRGTVTGLGYTVSLEPDFRTHGVGLSQAIDLLDRHATLALRYGFAASKVGRHGNLDRSRTTHSADASWTHILSKTVALDLSAGANFVSGYQANPYRFVRLYAPGASGAHVTAVTEAVPSERFRGIALARLRARVVPHVFVLGEYRFFADTWGVTAHTVTGRVSGGLWSDRLTLSAEVRGYLQDGASFYRARYDTAPVVPARRTADKELGPMASLTGGLSAELSLPLAADHTLRVGLGADVVRFEYLDYAFLAGRTAAIVVLDLTWEH